MRIAIGRHELTVEIEWRRDQAKPRFSFLRGPWGPWRSQLVVWLGRIRIEAGHFFRAAVALALLASIATPALAAKKPKAPTPKAGAEAVSPKADGYDLPDPKVTPGEADPGCDVKNVCPHKDASVVRDVTQKEKDETAALYGYDSCPGEIDHLISLENCGANSAANRWCEPGKIPNAKDGCENRAHKALCDGRITKAQLQKGFASNWVAFCERYGWIKGGGK